MVDRTYGQVFRAKAVKSGKIVAIKKFKESDQEDEHVNKSSALSQKTSLGTQDCPQRNKSSQELLKREHREVAASF